MLSTYPDLKEIDSSTLEEIKNSNILGKPQETKYGIVLTTILSNIINIDYQVRNELRNFAAKSDTIQVDEELEEEKRLEEKRRSKKIEEKEGRRQEEKRKQEEEEKRKEEQQRKKEEELKTVFFSDENRATKKRKCA